MNYNFVILFGKNKQTHRNTFEKDLSSAHNWILFKTLLEGKERMSQTSNWVSELKNLKRTPCKGERSKRGIKTWAKLKQICKCVFRGRSFNVGLLQNKKALQHTGNLRLLEKAGEISNWSTGEVTKGIHRPRRALCQRPGRLSSCVRLLATSLST